MSGGPVAAFWCRVPSRPNFGDALTPWLIQRLTGRYPTFRWPGDPCHKYLVAGSIAGLAGPACTVWGSGIMDADDRIGRGATLLAVRGPLTRARAIGCGVDCPEALGDPALLLPRLYRPPRIGGGGIGLALHFSDYPRLLGRADRPLWTRLIDMQGRIPAVIDRLAACDLVATSSLHGLIVAHAYGVPATWIEFRPLPSGDGSKFRDYLLSIGCRRDGPLHLSPRRLDPDLLREHSIEAPDPAELDLGPLRRSCPFGPLPGEPTTSPSAASARP